MNDVVTVVALDKYTGEIKTTYSCDRKDAARHAKYYRSIGYRARIVTDEQLDILMTAEYAERIRQERMCKNGLQVL